MTTSDTSEASGLILEVFMDDTSDDYLDFEVYLSSALDAEALDLLSEALYEAISAAKTSGVERVFDA